MRLLGQYAPNASAKFLRLLVRRFGLTADGDDLPNPSRVVRYVPYGKMRRDGDSDICLGPAPSAFEAGPRHRYLSVTWCEFFEGEADAQLRCAVEAIRGSKIGVRAKACFCVASAAEVLNAIADAGRVGRAVYHPEDDNAAHAGVHGVPSEEALLLSRLADEVWSTFLTKDTANALPTRNCTKSADIEQPARGKMVPLKGLEPPTPSLRMTCSTI